MTKEVWCEAIELIGLAFCGRNWIDWLVTGDRLVWKKILDTVGLCGIEGVARLEQEWNCNFKLVFSSGG
jgi:hypothetical protein